MKQQFLLPGLQPTAIELARLVARLAALEDEKKDAMADYKERQDLLKLQIKQAAAAINDSLYTVKMTVRAVPEEQAGLQQ
jgi:hypothetical protein